MDKEGRIRSTVKFNFIPDENRILLLTEKTGCPSANFRYRWGHGVIVSDKRQSSADP